MKKIILLFLILITASSYAQKKTNDNKDGTYKNKDSIINTSITDLLKSNEQCTISYKLAEEIIKIPINKGYVEFTKVIKADNTPKDKLYIAVKNCLVDLFGSYNDVSQMDDKESAIIIVKGFKDNFCINNDALLVVMVDVLFSCKVECKDNRYKVTVYNFHSRHPDPKFSHIGWSEYDCLTLGARANRQIKKGTWPGVGIVGFYDTANYIFDNIEIEVKNLINKQTSEDW